MNDTPQTPVLIRDVRYGSVDGHELLLDILRPEPVPERRMPVIMEIHHGAWMYGEKDGARNRVFAEYGFFTVSIDYRLSGAAPFPAQIEDVQAAVRWVRTHADPYHLDPTRIGVWGESSGGISQRWSGQRALGRL